MGRFSNAIITSDRPGGAQSFLLTGRPNIGKTFFASTIPNLFFIPIEHGLRGTSPDHPCNRARDPNGTDIVPRSPRELIEGIDYFLSVAKANGYRHLCLDSMTGIEKLINREVCSKERVAHMEAKEFKEVWGAAVPLWEQLLQKLESVQAAGFNWWVITHSAEADETDNNGVLYKKWDLHFDGTGKVLVNMRNEWRRRVENVLFIDWDASVRAGKVMTSKAVGVYKARVLYTRESPRHYAKNRSNLPPMLPATWEDLEKALKAGTPASETKLRQQIANAARVLNDEHQAIINADLAKARSVVALAAVLSRATGFASVEREDAADLGEDEQPEDAPEETLGAVANVDPLGDEAAAKPTIATAPDLLAEVENTDASVALAAIRELDAASDMPAVVAVWKAYAPQLTKDGKDSLQAACAARKAQLSSEAA